MMQYGSQTVTETKYRGGKVVSTATTFRESVLIADEPHLLAEILKHLEQCKRNGWLDPAFETVTDRETKQIKRLVKCWTEYS